MVAGKTGGLNREPRSGRGVTVAVINYNGERELGRTLDSIQRQDYPLIDEVLLVDDVSTDGSVSYVARRYPHVRIIQMETNRGPNPARNTAIRQARSPLVLIMDKDIVLEKDAVSLLEASLRANSNAGAASAQIRFLDDPGKIQYNGCHIHYVGEAVQNMSGSEEPAVVGAVSAGTVLVDRAKAMRIGLFDEDFFFGWEDGDFTFRMTLTGYPCLVVPAAKVFHNTEKKVIRRVYYQVRNRWWFILKTYDLRTLVVVLPAILLYQVGVLCFLTWKGYFVDFVRGTCAAFGNLRMVAEKRREVMQHKCLRDRDVLRGRGFDLLLDVEGSRITNRAYTLLDKVFSAYWFFAKRWLA